MGNQCFTLNQRLRRINHEETIIRVPSVGSRNVRANRRRHHRQGQQRAEHQDHRWQEGHEGTQGRPQARRQGQEGQEGFHRHHHDASTEGSSRRRRKTAPSAASSIPRNKSRAARPSGVRPTCRRGHSTRMKPSGDRQWRRHAFFSGVHWNTPAASSRLPPKTAQPWGAADLLAMFAETRRASSSREGEDEASHYFFSCSRLLISRQISPGTQLDRARLVTLQTAIFHQPNSLTYSNSCIPKKFLTLPDLVKPCFS